MSAATLWVWLSAARLRTLPLSLACIVLGTFLAADAGFFRLDLAILTVLTTVSYQILSNFSNDYFDFQKGSDAHRTTVHTGEMRSVASGAISPSAMRKAVWSAAGVASILGFLLVYMAFEGAIRWVFLGLHFLALWSALQYVGGKVAYGYRGWGDFFVVFFFGWVGVEGSFMVQTGSFSPWVLLPGLSVGLLAAGVLNLNNIRDRETDPLTGKITIAVRLGLPAARWYQTALVSTAVLLSVFFVLRGVPTCSRSFLFLATLPLLYDSVRHTWKASSRAEWDALLKPLALATLLFAFLLGFGLYIDADSCSKPLF